MDWFYYNENGQRIGPISAAVLKELVKAGVIKHETVIENANGRSSRAGDVKGLDFPAQTKPTCVDVPMPTQPQSSVASVPKSLGETIEFEARPDWFRGFILHHISCVLLAVTFVIATIAVFPPSQAIGVKVQLVFFILFALIPSLLLILPLQLMVWLPVCATKLTITNKKTIFWRGILTRTEVELLHSDIQSIVIRQGLLQRLLGIGTVVIATSATSRAAGIKAYRFLNPDIIKRFIQQYQKE